MTACPLTRECPALVATVVFIECREMQDARLRQEVARFGGRIWRSTDDGLMATFELPSRAIRCVQSLRSLGLELRAGMHAGQIALGSDDVTGVAVHVAEQVLDSAAAGTALVSRTVAELAAGSGLDLVDLGGHDELTLFLVG